MPTHNLIEYGEKYSKTSGTLWNYYRHEPNSSILNNVYYSISNSKSFDYKTSITGQLEGTDIEKNPDIAVALTFLENIRNSFD